MNSSWFARFVDTQQQWIAARNQGIADAGALSDAISRSNDEFNQDLMQQWQQRTQAEERASREFSEYIHGSENYYDPANETHVELPGGYQQAWSNNQGEYLLSNDPGFNPNNHDNIYWDTITPLP
jgi:ABC-type transporter Mla subunit MlaD